MRALPRCRSDPPFTPFTRSVAIESAIGRTASPARQPALPLIVTVGSRAACAERPSFDTCTVHTKFCIIRPFSRRSLLFSSAARSQICAAFRCLRDAKPATPDRPYNAGSRPTTGSRCAPSASACGNSPARCERRVPDHLRRDVRRRRLRAALLPQASGAHHPSRYRTGRPALSRADDGEETMTTDRYSSVWDAIEGQPAEAENMKLRSELMIALKQRIAQLELSQAQAAERLGVTQPRVSDLMRGKINLFSRRAREHGGGRRPARRPPGARIRVTRHVRCRDARRIAARACAATARRAPHRPAHDPPNQLYPWSTQ